MFLMIRLRRHIVVLPIALFLVIVLGAPILTVHHVHLIHADHSDGQRQTEERESHSTPVTYQEDHIITLRSGDDYNSSAPAHSIADVHQFVAPLSDLALPTSLLLSFPLWSFESRHVFPPAGDKCALFCSFLI